MNMKLTTVILILLYSPFVFAQNTKENRLTFIELDTLASSRIFKIWELHTMDSNKVYFSRIALRNKEFSKRDKKNYFKLIRESKRHKPKELYLIFEQAKRYQIDTVFSYVAPPVNSLIIEEVDLNYYRKPSGIFNDKLIKELLKNRFVIFRYKEINPLSVKYAN